MYKNIVNRKELQLIYEKLFRSFSSDMRHISVALSIILIVISLGPIIIYAMSAILNGKADTSLPAGVKALWSVYWITIFLILPISIVYNAVKRQWFVCVFLLLPILYYLYVLIPLREYALDDRFLLVSKSHQENADLYAAYTRGGGDGKQELIGFGRKCNPPAGCDCWAIKDNEAVSELKNVTGEWQVPYGTFTSAFEAFKAYHLVSVKPISEREFSLIGCDLDWRMWWTQ